MKPIRYILLAVLMAMLPWVTSCEDASPADVSIDGGDEVLADGIAEGEKVLFGVQLLHGPMTRAEKTPAETSYDAMIDGFKRVEDDYVFTVEMYEEGKAEAIATVQYNPIKDEAGKYEPYGTLQEAVLPDSPEGQKADSLYWNSNVKKYAFRATAGTETLDSDQTTPEQLLLQDRLEGYGYVPGWDPQANNGEGASRLDLDGLNYLTAKEWYAANKAYAAELGGLPLDPDFLKKVPLYMRHKRALITVRFKAGEGIERSQLEYNERTLENIAVKIYSYDDANKPQEITPLMYSYACDYTPKVPNDPENTVQTVCYDAIVTPHNYAAGSNLTDQRLLWVNLSNSRFSFYAANDDAYVSYVHNTAAENASALLNDVLTRYNLEAGKHLILDVTLSTDTRKILITAYVVDWVDYIYSSICDDFGQPGNPIEIKDKASLKEFLENPQKNKAGNVGIVTPMLLDLLEGGSWNPADYELKATLKLAGATIRTDNRLFRSIASSGMLVNGTVQIANVASPSGGGATTPDIADEAAIALENSGTIERMTLQRAANCERQMSRAGLVVTNYGTIYRCTSRLPVRQASNDADVYVGGIAAENVYPVVNGEAVKTTMPTIDQCVVDARVDGGSQTRGGGIVGKAEGQVSNNTFEYGITLLQDPARFKNILHTKGSQDLSNFDNQWPTLDENTVTGASVVNKRAEGLRYNKVIDSQAELHELLVKNTYNQSDLRYRIADSFAVDDTWELGNKPEEDAVAVSNVNGNLLCELNGNDKTITLTGQTTAPMLFCHVANRLYDLTLRIEKPIVSEPTEQNKLPAIAPLGYSVNGNGVLRNIQVKAAEGTYVQATMPAGLVVWAYDGAVIEDCQSNADVLIRLPETEGSQQTYFVGGLVSAAAKATIRRCSYNRKTLHADNKTDDSRKVYYGGIVGGVNRKSANGDETDLSYPELAIYDCTSWLEWAEPPVRPYWGGIIGFTKYQKTSATDMPSGMVTDCQGNWWAAPVGVPSSGLAADMSQEKAIGKKNSVNPVYNDNYNK